ncbi:MAG: hypothetical protein ACM31C_18080 [Acidobacteriota bacterium]
MNSSLVVLVLAVGCTSASQPQVTPPDPQMLPALFPPSPRVETTPPFTLDLAACAYTRYAVPDGTVGDSFVLAHPSDDGHCEVWIGFATDLGEHADVYCSFEQVGTAQVTTGSTGGPGGCGGPPGSQMLSIASSRCITLAQ